MPFKEIVKTLATLTVLIFPFSASAERIELKCKIDRGWDWSVGIDLERDELKFNQMDPIPIVEKNSEWIIANSTGLPTTLDGKAVTYNWVLNRLTGELWHSRFAYTCNSSNCSDGEYKMLAFTGICSRGF